MAQITHSRPRFRASRKAGVNLMRHPRWNKRQRRSGGHVGRRAGNRARPFFNKDRFEYGSVREGTMAGGRANVNHKQRRTTEVAIRKYFGLGGGKVGSYGKDVKGVPVGNSLLGPFSLGVGRVLQQVGFVSTRLQARNRVQRGRVRIGRYPREGQGGDSTSTLECKWSRVDRVSYRMRVGDVLAMDPLYWGKEGAAIARGLWDVRVVEGVNAKASGIGVFRPRTGSNQGGSPTGWVVANPYMEVDFIYGTVALVREPVDGEVWIPEGREFDMTSLLAR